jgi:hypothetical protein
VTEVLKEDVAVSLIFVLEMPSVVIAPHDVGLENFAGIVTSSTCRMHSGDLLGVDLLMALWHWVILPLGMVIRTV